MIRNIEKLWSLSGTDRSSFTGNENYFYDSIGLILLTEIKHHGYWCTPSNSITFAETGGDGVHYSLLVESDKVDENSPVIMTLPCAENCNIIVAENFLEFLSLGCRAGYFDIEQIEYERDFHLAQLDSNKYSEEADEEQILLLKRIEDEFSLVPRINHGARFAELEQKYFKCLKYSTEYYEMINC
jgi:hypothetical protein